jgi:hypothetical protein
MKRILIPLLLSVASLAQGGFSGAGRYEISSPLSNKVLDMDRNDRRTIIQFEPRRTDNQFWDITDAGGGYYYIRNAMNGNALAVQNDRNSTPLIAEPYNGSSNQQWRIEQGRDGGALLTNRNGKVVDIPNGSRRDGERINSYSRNNNSNQQWTFNPAGRTGGFDRDNRDSRRPSRGSRYDTPGAGSTSTSTAMFFDDRERMYKMNGDGVCVYRDRDFRGDAVCASVRDGMRQWTAPFSSIGSVKFFGRATGVQFFDRENFRGNSTELTGDERNVSSSRYNLRDSPRSMRVY